MKDFRYMAIVAAAAVGLAVAGCGSSGSDDDTASTPAVTPPTQAELDAEKARADAAEAEAKRLQDEKDAEAQEAGKAKLKRLATAIGPVDLTDSDTLAMHFRPLGTNNADVAKPKMDVEDSDDPHSIDGWAGSTYLHTPKGMATTSVSYNNEEQPTSVLFSKWVMDVAADGVTVTVANGAYTLNSAAHGKHIEITGMPTHPSHTPLTIGNTNGERGTLNGVSGRFKAGNGDVSISVNDNDVPVWSTNDLTFTPDSPTAMVSQEDQSYMSLGWWLNETTSDGTLDVDVAAWGSQPYTNDDTGHGNALTGKATFEGIAVGKYTHKTVNDISGGHFNADAELTADFGTNSTGGSLTGTIDNFEQDGEAIGDGWKVTLNDTSTDGNGNIGTDFAVAAENGAATGTFGRHETDGTWRALFVGDGRKDPMPEGVVGEFHIGALGDPINMVGAFAATNQEADQVVRK